MPIEEIKNQIIARETDTAKFLYEQLKRNPNGNIAGNEQTVIFVALPGSDQVLQFHLCTSENSRLNLKLKAWKELKNIEINGQTTADFDPNLDNIWNNLLNAQKDIAKFLLDKYIKMAEKNESNLPETIKTSDTKTVKKPDIPKDETGFAKIISAAMARTDATTPEEHFWKTNANPWFDDKKKYKEGTYILKVDYPIVSNYIGEGGTKIRDNVLPQPYIGDPDAPIWILSMNPSYSAVDIFDFVDEVKGKEAIRNDKDCSNYHVETALDGKITFRKTLIEFQNRFAFDKLKDTKEKENFNCPWFYVLDKNFHTIKERDDTKSFGSYEWWRNHLLEQNICNRDTGKLKKFFVLESFPYHSESFDDSQEFFDKVVSKVSHYKFWKQMIEFALQKNKIMLCRGDSIAERVSKIAKDRNKSDAQIFVFKNYQRLWISTNNFKKY